MITKEIIKKQKGVIWKQTTLENVYVCNYGIFYNTKTKRYSRSFRKGSNKNGYIVKINGKNHNAARLLFEAFNGSISKDMIVLSRLRTKDLNILHLELITQKELGHRTGGNVKKKIMVEVHDLEGNYIGTYRSVRRAAKALFISYQTVLDYLNGKVKKPMYNVKKVTE